MGRLLKRLFRLLAALLLLVVAAAMLAPYVLDPADYLGDARAQVLAATGLELRLKGEMTLSLLPWVGLDTGPLELAIPGEPGEVPLLSLENARIRMEYTPLISGELALASVDVTGLVLNLSPAAGPPTPPPAQEDLPDRAGEPEAGASLGQDSAEPGPGFALALSRGLRLSDALVAYREGDATLELRIADLDLGPVDLRPGNPGRTENFTPLAFAGSFADTATGYAGSLRFSARAAFDREFRTPRLEGLALTLAVRGPGLPEAGADLFLNGDLAYDPTGAELRGEKLLLRGLGVEARGNATLTLAPALAATADLDLSCAPRQTLAALGRDAPVTSDPEALQTFSLAGQLTLSRNALSLSGLRGALDRTIFLGSAAAHWGARPQVSLALRLDQLDLNRYLPPDQAQSEPGSPLEALAALGGVDLSGNLEIGRLVLGGEVLEAVRFSLEPVPVEEPLELELSAPERP